LIGQWAHALILVDAEGRIQDLNAEGQVVVGCDPDSGELISDRIPLSMNEIRAYAADRPGTIRRCTCPAGTSTGGSERGEPEQGRNAGYSIFLRRPAREGQIAAMSKRELDVYALLLKGMSTKEGGVYPLRLREHGENAYQAHLRKAERENAEGAIQHTPTPFGGE
jgi:hypothetical protein